MRAERSKFVLTLCRLFSICGPTRDIARPSPAGPFLRTVHSPVVRALPPSSRVNRLSRLASSIPTPAIRSAITRLPALNSVKQYRRRSRLGFVRAIFDATPGLASAKRYRRGSRIGFDRAIFDVARDWLRSRDIADDPKLASVARFWCRPQDCHRQRCRLGFVRAILALGSFAQFWSWVRSRNSGLGFVRAVLVLGSFAQFWPWVRSRSFGLGLVRAVLVLGSFAQFWSWVRSRNFGLGFVRAILVPTPKPASAR
jgi:hypothetical protein